MENKIDIAELLKDCPSGMELDCTMYENVYFDKIYDEDCLYQIGCYTINDGVRNSINFTKYGKFNTTKLAKCVIFPKGKTTWEEFTPPCKFKDGDIVYTRYDNKDGYIFIFESITENTHVNSYLHLKGDDLRIIKTWLTNCDDKYLRLATKEEKEKLFQAIKDNGYKWNEETKTLEKLVEPKFKVGDKVLWNYDTKIIKTISQVQLTKSRGYVYWIDGKGCSSGWWNENELTPIPNKFDITTLKPFDKVLVIDSDKEMWCASIFSHTWEDKYFCIGAWYYQCIPYEAYKELLGTTNNPKEHGSN